MPLLCMVLTIVLNSRTVFWATGVEEYSGSGRRTPAYCSPSSCVSPRSTRWRSSTWSWTGSNSMAVIPRSRR